MNRRFYCVVGVASGLVLLGGGVAQAGATADEADRNIDPRATSGLPTDIFTPAEAQHRLVASSDTDVEKAGSMTPGRAKAAVRQQIESSSRAEVLPGLGGNIGADGLLGLLGGLPGGSVIGKLTGEGGPLGQLLGGGPLGGLLGAKKAPANDGGQPGATTPNSPRTQRPAMGGDDGASDWGQAGPDGGSPFGAMDMHGADPAMSGQAANPARRPATVNRPATHPAGDAPAVRGDVAGEGPTPGASNSGTGIPEGAGIPEKEPAGGLPLVGSIFGPEGPLGSVQLLGGQTLKGVPLLGDLLGGGLSLDKLNVPAVSEVVNQIGAEDGDKASPALGQLATVGKLSRMLLGGESASAPTESANARHSIDKTKVTPELLPLFGPDELGTQELGGIIYQLPSAG